MENIADNVNELEKKWNWLVTDIYSGRMKQQISQLLENQASSLKEDNPFFEEHVAPTNGITGLELEKFITDKTFKVFKHNDKPYMVACAICVNEGTEDHGGGDTRYGFATVHPKDEFNEQIGMELAYKRALGLDKGDCGKRNKRFNSEVSNWESSFDSKHNTVPIMCRPEGMLRLVRMCMPTITANKYVSVTENDVYHIKRK